MNIFFNEWSDYKLFVSTFFPESELNLKINLIKSSTESLFKCIYLTEIIIDEFNGDLSDDEVEILLDGNRMIYRLLYILPSGEKYFVSSAIRGLSESLLRTLLLRESTQLSLQNLKGEQFRYLKDKVKKTSTYSNCKSIIDKVISLFGQHSKIIHNKKKHSEHITYLEDYMYGFDSYTADQLNSNIKMLATALIDVLVLNYQFDPDLISQYNKRVYKQIFE
ncbi:hypothetical protein [Enterococcus avium]|uniref:hypothetical protein n=1 Tax=Enterococcus avium TaxID=33945 RepID=UPI002E0F9FE7